MPQNYNVARNALNVVCFYTSWCDYNIYEHECKLNYLKIKWQICVLGPSFLNKHVATIKNKNAENQDSCVKWNRVEKSQATKELKIT